MRMTELRSRLDEATRYEDTEQGARELAADFLVKSIRIDSVKADASVPGCWVARSDDGRLFLIYTSVHPLGPDVEEVEGVDPFL